MNIMPLQLSIIDLLDSIIKSSFNTIIKSEAFNASSLSKKKEILNANGFKMTSFSSTKRHKYFASVSLNELNGEFTLCSLSRFYAKNNFFNISFIYSY
jgi:beta-xylosidase